MGISHRDIIKHCNGTLKLGLKFDGFNQDGESFTFPFGVGQGTNYNAASLDRMIETKLIPHNILEYRDISVHFRSPELLAYMDTLVSQFSNLTIVRNTIESSNIKGFDLIIDSTGFKRVMSKWNDNFVDLSDKIQNNQALVYRHVYTDTAMQCVPYSTFNAADAGWIWNIPLGDQLAVGYVHNSKFDVQDEFVKYLENKFYIGIDKKDIRTVPMKTGRNKIHMQNNVVAIGLSSAFIEPIESTGLYITTSALYRLSKYIDGQIDQDEYNHETNHEFDSIVNFILAHYKYSKRTNAYWDFYKNADVVDWQSIEIFPEQAWGYILSGFRQDVPRPRDPMNTTEFIEIQQGTAYYKWLDNERNSA